MPEPSPQNDRGPSEEYSEPFATVTPIAITFARVLPMVEMKARYVFAVVSACKGNRTEAAKMLGMSRSGVLALLSTARKLGLGAI